MFITCGFEAVNNLLRFRRGGGFNSRNHALYYGIGFDFQF